VRCGRSAVARRRKEPGSGGTDRARGLRLGLPGRPRQ
jgi:hypothetical protein